MATLRGRLPHPTFAASVVLQGLLMLEAISLHLDKVNVCFDIANGGAVMGLSGRSLRGSMVSCSDVKTRCVIVGRGRQKETEGDKIAGEGFFGETMCGLSAKI